MALYASFFCAPAGSAVNRVAGTYEPSIGIGNEGGLARLVLPLSRSERDRQALEGQPACFHCGEPCPDPQFTIAEKSFCCHGCLTVHELLAAAGLEQFYALERHPGTRVRRAHAAERWSYLDTTEVRQKLLDFTDGKTARVRLHVPAIHCVACVWLLENLFRLHPGIGQSTVNFPRREVAISFAPDKIALSEVAALLDSIGYEPRLTLGELDRTSADPSSKRRWLQIGVAGFAFGNIMLFSIPTYLGLDSFSERLFRALFGYLSLGLALPVLFYSASDYWRAAWVSLRQRTVTLEVPIALGLAALYLQSAGEIVSGHGEGYLDSLAGLVFFLLCGRAFQHKTFDRITFERDYKCFFPLSVIRKNAVGESSVALSELRVGDRLLLRNGELVPADCRLSTGEALVDYSFVTGESEPVSKVAGDYLYAGGKQTGGAIEVEILKPVSQSYLASLWSHETFRKTRHDQLNTVTNRYSRRFTKLVITIAVGAGLFWYVSGDGSKGLKAFASVLIVACPCALALAAPFALGTAQRLLARLNVFLKNPLVLERMAEVDTVVFDKTGTLTAADSGAKFEPAGGIAAGDVQAIWSLARHCTHPHCLRICRALSGDAPSAVRDFAEIPGSGIQGRVDRRQIRLGSRRWLEALALEFPAKDNPEATHTWVAIDGKVVGAFSFPSLLRPDTGKMLSDLKRRCQLALLSGDNDRDHDEFLELFGSDAALCFDQRPLDKLTSIQQLQQQGGTVMMVGDGLNDAGALKQSDVGVAVVERIGIFSPASDVILQAARVPDLAKVVEFARKSARIVRLSFVLSAVYNAVGVSIAAAGVLSPVICAVLMPLSSVSVVLFACGAVNLASRSVFGPASNADTLAPLALRNGVLANVEPSTVAT